jgi:hypothetical protein
VTGDIDVSKIQNKSPKGGSSKFNEILEKQLPFLAKILNKLQKKKNTNEEIEEVVETTDIDININESTKPDLASPKQAIKNIATDDKTGDIVVNPSADTGPVSNKPYFADLDEEPAPKKKLKIKVWHAIVILGLLVFLLLDSGEESKNETVPDVAIPQGSRIKKMVDEVGLAEKKDVINADPKPTEEAKTDAPSESETTKTEEPTEVSVEEPQKVETSETPLTTENPPESEVIDKMSEDQPVEDLPTSTEIEATPETEVKEDSTEIEMVGESESNEDGTETQPVENVDDITSDILENLEKKVSTDDSQEDKKIEYVEPPDYENLGRGLVYNCLGKHWACIDAASFTICKKNQEANKALNKKTECHHAEVYDTNEDCIQMQRNNIHGLANTSFCN